MSTRARYFLGALVMALVACAVATIDVLRFPDGSTGSSTIFLSWLGAVSAATAAVATFAYLMTTAALLQETVTQNVRARVDAVMATIAVRSLEVSVNLHCPTREDLIIDVLTPADTAQRAVVNRQYGVDYGDLEARVAVEVHIWNLSAVGSLVRITLSGTPCDGVAEDLVGPGARESLRFEAAASVGAELFSQFASCSPRVEVLVRDFGKTGRETISASAGDVALGTQEELRTRHLTDVALRETSRARHYG